MKRTSTLLILGIIVVLGVGVYTGYTFWKKAANADDLKRVEATLTEYQNKILQFESKDLLEAINAKRTLSDLEGDMIQWSKVIKTIRKTIPTDNGLSIVEILSYSGSTSNDINMNVKTYPDRKDPYFDVADLIKAFEESSSFVGSFVPSISGGTNEDGEEILTFLFGATYVEADPLALLEDDVVEEEGEAVLR
ncbi:MAG: hypothetical protein GWP15_00340 [Nitrospirae bacterium]|nr:hypothetical protein [Nitrospirota bacterium]